MPDVTLLKTPSCRVNCDKVAAELDKRGISYVFVVIDTDDDQHVAMLAAADKAGYKASPVFCLQGSDGSLSYVSAGPEPIAIHTLKSTLGNLTSVDA